MICWLKSLRASSSCNTKVREPSVAVLDGAHEKAKRKAAEYDKYIECLRAGVCPACASELDEKLYGSFLQFTDHKCTHCSFKTEMEVLY